MPKTVYSALKPTGDLQLGNYIGALNNMVKLQEDYNCIYTVADMHSITVDCVPADLRKRTYDFMALFLAIGLDPEKSILFVQSHVPQHAELAWVLNCFTQYGEARRMTQFKEKSHKNPENVNLGLFAYPTLMAADILLYNADYVPIGKDQKQHLELARTVAERFNNRFSPTFTVPDGIFNKVGAKIQNLLDPTAKMGKTDDNANGVVFLLDDADTVMRKFRRAVTDSDNRIIVAPDKPGISNLITIYSVFSGISVAETEKKFEGVSYAEFKTQVGEAVVNRLAPVRQKYNELIADKAYLNKVMKEGAEKASYIASKTLSKVYRKVGFAQYK
ncbi:MAG TPA: tryptophan--tRNA ligase [Candidatus Faecicola pullistercoris]|nr:tryptophan--tRNA ligase [Candidatus Faecicola pullistercoris]